MGGKKRALYMHDSCAMRTNELGWGESEGMTDMSRNELKPEDFEWERKRRGTRIKRKNAA